jgi:L-fuconolactonase
MTRIDAHHHFWRYDPVEYSWISDDMSAIRRSFGPADLAAEQKRAGLDGAVSVQARQSLEETWQLLTYADQNDFIKGVVGWVPLTSPDLNRTLATVATHPKLRAVRHVLQDEPDPFYILREDFNRGIAALQPFHLTYDILIFERHLPQTIEFVDRHPNQVFVVDHLAKPRVKEGLISPWRENLRKLAERPNVYCKMSGLATEADHRHWTEDQLRPYMNVVLEAFTPKRVMFGSDWPVCLVAVDYGAWVKIVERSVAALSLPEQERIWGGTAREAYRLS